MSADSPRRSSGSRGIVAATVPPQVVSDRSILDSAIGFINDVALTNQPHTDPKDTITWARFETSADISDPRYGEDWELEGNVAPPLLLILGYGLGVQVWAIPANGEAVEVLSWRHGIVSALRILPTPTTNLSSTELHGRADELVDMFADKRPLVAIVDGSTAAGSQPQFCAVNFVSLKTGSQVKAIKFKNPVLDIVANRSSIVITFHERIAVFDARTLEDRLSITTCFPSPGINPNPVALGPRWLAYSEHKLLHSKRSGGGCDGEGVASYTATVLNAAKSLGKGLRELGEQVAAGLTGTSGSAGNSKNNSFDSQCGVDGKQPGVITILDIKHPIKDYSPTSGTPLSGYGGTDPIVAHFVAHSEAIVAMEFDNSGLLLVTADRRGHDFHIFSIQPHPLGSSLAAVHHLYVLHRGDTSAKVQNIAFSLDSRWVAVSTLRGTTHVFPITPYGGPMGVRTHTSLHVVNKLSRFHRSAGLSADGRSCSPISHSESTTFTQSLQPYHNTTLPPFPRPNVVQPLTQLRQPFALGSPPGSAGLSMGGVSVGTKSGSGSSSQRQRLSSLSDDNGKPLSVCSIFAKSRSWLLEPPNVTREAPHRIQRKAVDSLFVMAGHGALIQYDLDTKLASNVAKEKICDDTPIELEVEAKAQWNLGRRKEGSQEIMPPLSSDNWLIRNRNSCILMDSTRHFDDIDERTDSWLSQVEIVTHAGPHRRLWMGPQFVFKTYNAPSGSNLSLVDIEAVEISAGKASATAAALTRTERSSPLSIAGRSAVPVLIESGSYSSIEQSPKLMDRFRHDHLDSDFAVAHGDTRLKEDLADAMRESPSVSAGQKEAGRSAPSDGVSSADNPTFYDALADHENEHYETEVYVEQSFDANRSSTSKASAVALASVLPNLSSYDTSSGYESFESFRRPKPSIEKIVNPLGTVTTITAGMSAEVKTDMLDEVVSQLASEECVIHENCDEALFRPVVAIFCDEKERKRSEEEAKRNEKFCQPPEMINTKLIVPVIAKEVDAELSKKEKEKSGAKSKQQKKEQSKLIVEKKEPLTEFDNRSDANNFKLKNKPDLQPTKAQQKIDIVDKSDKSEKSDKSNIKEYKVKVVESVSKKPKEINAPKNLAKLEVISKCEEESTKEKSKTTTTATVCEKETKPKEKEILIKKDSTASIVMQSSAKENTAKKISSIKNKEKETEIEGTTKSSVENKQNKSFELIGAEGASPTKSGQIKAGHLNVADLADSLIEHDNVKTAEMPIIEKLSKNLKSSVQSAIMENVVERKLSSSVVKDHKESKVSKELSFETKTKEIVKEDIKVKEPLKLDSVKPETIEKKENASKDQSTKSKPETPVIECKEDIKAEPLKLPTKAVIPDKIEENIAPPLPLSKSAKKKKKSQSRPSSNSNSETEEVVEVATTQQKSKKSKQKERRSSISSEGSCAESDQSFIVEPTSNKNESMFLSFLQTEEKTKKDIAAVEKVQPTKAEQNKNTLKEKLTEEEILEADIRSLTKSVEAQLKIIDKSKKKTEDQSKPEITEKEEKNLKPNQKQTIELEQNIEKSSKEIEDKNTNKGAIKKEIKSEESLTKNVVKTKQPTEPEVVKVETSKIPKTPPKSPKKKPIDAEKESANSKQSSVNSSPVKVITQQPTKSKHEITGFQNIKETKVNAAVDVTDSSNSSKTATKVTSATPTTPQKVSNTTVQLTPPTSPWKTMSGADLINKNLESFSNKAENLSFPSLGKESKSAKKLIANDAAEKLLPDLPTPVKPVPDLKPAVNRVNTKSKKSSLDDFPLLNPLGALPPLPSLEPLEVPKMCKNTTSLLTDQMSLINFENVFQDENVLASRKNTTTPPRSANEQNLLYALCGGKEDFSMPSLSDLPDTPFTEPIGIETKLRKKVSPSEKYFSSSPCSSASEEIIVLEEKKMTKKQKRKRQQHLLEKENLFDLKPKSTEVDEELCPLIGGMSDSQLYVDTMTSSDHFGMATTAPFLEIPSSTTTDSSEGPMPATTSDDNVFVMPSAIAAKAPNKVKTKKLEHKFNLIAAIEAATSSSTSSAEESGVEGGGGRASDTDATHYHHHHQYQHHHHGSLGGNNFISTSTSATAAMLTLPTSLSVSAQLSATKKKTKRRKR